MKDIPYNLLGGITLFILLLFTSCQEGDILSDEERKWLENRPPIKVAVYPHYPPYVFRDKEGAPTGILLDYLAKLENELNTEFEIVEYEQFSDLLEDAKKGEVEWILEVQKTESTKKYLSFYPKLFETPYVIVGPKDQQFEKSALKEAKFYLPKEFAIAETITKNFPNAQVISSCVTDEACIELLVQNKDGYYVAPKTVANYLIESKHLTSVAILAHLGRDYDPAVAALRGNENLNTILYKGLNQISFDERQEIIDRWLVKFERPFYKSEKFWISASIIFFSALLVLIVLNRYLRYTINKRTSELHKAKLEAEESSVLKTAFINNISHEMRTPMNAIMGFSSMLKKPNLDQETRLNYIEIINQGCLRLMDMMDNVLEVSLLQNGQVKTVSTAVNVSELIQACFDTFQTQAKIKNLDYRLENLLQPAQACILIDQNKLRKIVLHVLDNAIKFTNSGAITLKAQVKDDQLRILVFDTGIGIKEKRLPSIFDSYSKSNQASSNLFSGLGLGLSISQAYAQLLEGQISIDSTIGKGTQVCVEVPYKPVNATEFCSPETPQQPEKKEVFKVLIAEDAHLNYMFLKALLDRNPDYDIQVIRAENGKEAVEIVASEERVDLVLMDIQMPVMNGYQATTLIKKYNAGIPVVMQTAYSTSSDREKAQEAGCDDFISKPIEPEIFELTLKKFLGCKS